MRHGRLGHIKLFGQGSGRYFAVAKQAEDFPASRVSQGAKCLIAAHGVVKQMLN
jgi:hypothetical protein